MGKLLKKKVKVHWSDAVIYKASSIKNPVPTSKITEGVLTKKSKGFVILGNPHTINQKNKKRNSREIKRKATFLFIPHGMITKIEHLQK